MGVSVTRKDQFQLSEDAALWVLRMGAEPDTGVQREFFAWVRQSPRHMEEFLFARAISQEMAGMDPERQVQVNWGLLEGLKEENTHLTPAPSPPAGRRGGKRKMWIGLAASLMAMLGGWTLINWMPGTARTYSTDIGDQQAIKLRDGSLMELNTRSRAEVTYSDTARDIHLLAGEALFSVEQDIARPFRVHAEQAVIQAIGTRFNIYRRAGGTRVSVAEGAVRISLASARPLLLKAGAEADITGGAIILLPNPDLARALAWRTRRLVFHSDRLEDVAIEFNRYNRSQIRLRDAQVANRPISGVFDADDPQTLIDFLAAHPEFRVRRTEREIEIGRQ